MSAPVSPSQPKISGTRQDAPNAELVEILAEMGRDGDGACEVAAKIITAQDARIGGLEKENFALAANQCHAGYGDDYGNHRCDKIDAPTPQYSSETNPLRQLAEELREFTAMKYAGECKCGKCQLVPRALVERIYHTLNGAAIQRREAPEGYVIMPREATRVMTMAGCDSLPDCEHVFGHAGEMLKNAYAKMVDVCGHPPQSVDVAQQPVGCGDRIRKLEEFIVELAISEGRYKSALEQIASGQYSGANYIARTALSMSSTHQLPGAAMAEPTTVAADLDSGDARPNRELDSPDRGQDHEPRCNCGHLFELCPQADCTEIRPLSLPSTDGGAGK